MYHSKEKSLKNIIDELFIDYSIIINSNESPKDFIVYNNKNDEWIICYNKKVKYTDISCKRVWSVFEQNYENMSYNKLTNLIKNKLLFPLKLSGTNLFITKNHSSFL